MSPGINRKTGEQIMADYTKYDLEAAKILDDFIPDTTFDAHMHHEFLNKRVPGDDYMRYQEDFRPLLGNRKMLCNMIACPAAGMSDPVTGKAAADLDKTTEIIREQLMLHPEVVGEVMVAPGDEPEEIEKRIEYAGRNKVTGLKPYHLLSLKKPTFQANIGDYLPESAWEVADKHGLAITLHMVKDKALADPENLAYIKEHALRYKNVKFILAHCARSFAAWTAIETIDETAPIDNIFYDFAGVCESPQMFMIMKKAGIDKCLWGSDWTVSNLKGKCISIADSFYWIGENDIAHFDSKTEFHYWLVGTENLMAVRQAAMMMELKPVDIEKLFYKNAERLFLNK